MGSTRSPIGFSISCGEISKLHPQKEEEPVQIFSCGPVVLESICYHTTAKRLIKESNTTGGLRKIWMGRRRRKGFFFLTGIWGRMEIERNRSQDRSRLKRHHQHIISFSFKIYAEKKDRRIRETTEKNAIWWKKERSRCFSIFISWIRVLFTTCRK